jgi:membrane-bound lytic murein transglycosylase D
MSAWLKRMGRYRTLITRTLEKHRVPRSLIYVAMIESGFNPRLTSRAGAAGIWQFMKRTGRGYGLQRDYWIDERRNPKLSTEAGARYLKDLHKRFGSWELALAAYNAGYFAVQRSIKKYNTNDYWQICRYESGLPWSTTLYVPKVLATAIVALNRTYFGYSNVQAEPELRYDLVSVPTSITLGQAGRAAGVTKDEVALLNPELRRGRTPPSSKAWLRIPRGKKRAFYANLARMKGQLARYRPYVVRLGETVTDLAASLGISRHRLRQVNGMRRDADLRPGLIILVPARRTRTSVADAPKQGGGAGAGSAAPSTPKLLVAVPRGTPRAIPGRRRVFYRTVEGDRLPVIALYLGVSTAELRLWNKLDPAAKLLPDMVLQAFVPQSFDASRVVLLDPRRIQVMVAGSEKFLNTYEERNGRKRVIYTARAGDTLRSVGRRFGLSVGSVARINRFSRRTKLKAGQRLVVYVDPAKLRTRKKKRRRKAGVRVAQRDGKPAKSPRKKKRLARKKK